MAKIKTVNRLSDRHNIEFTWFWKPYTRQTYVCPTCYACRRLREQNSMVCPACKKDVMLIVPWYLSIPKKAHIKKFVDSLLSTYREDYPKYLERRKLEKMKLL